MTRLGRNVPDDDLLTIRRGQELFFGFRKARGFGGRAFRLRYRKEERALRKKQHAKTGDINGRDDNQEPFQDDHVRKTQARRKRPYKALTMFSVIFLASPSSIMVLSR